MTVQVAVYADVTRVENFHQQKRYIQSPRRINPYIRPYKSPSYPILSQRRVTHIGARPPRVEYRYNPRYNSYYQDRQPQRYVQTSCNSYPRRTIIAHPMSHPRYHVGERIDSLPFGAIKVLIDNRRYYSYENTYFVPRYNAGQRFYVVVDF